MIVRFLCFPAFAASLEDFFATSLAARVLDARRRAAPPHQFITGENFGGHVYPLVLVIVFVGLSCELALPPSSARLSVSSAKARPFYFLKKRFRVSGCFNLCQIIPGNDACSIHTICRPLEKIFFKHQVIFLALFLSFFPRTGTQCSRAPSVPPCNVGGDHTGARRLHRLYHVRAAR